MPDLDSLQKKILWMRLCFITEKNPNVNPFLMRLCLWWGRPLHGIYDDNSYEPTLLSREKYVSRQKTAIKRSVSSGPR